MDFVTLHFASVVFFLSSFLVVVVAVVCTYTTVVALLCRSTGSIDVLYPFCFDFIPYIFVLVLLVPTCMTCI